MSPHSVRKQFNGWSRPLRFSKISATANDPHGEHDFGAFEFDGTPVIFKIDYYDKDLNFHSPDPGDPAVTERVITLMLAEEY